MNNSVGPKIDLNVYFIRLTKYYSNLAKNWLADNVQLASLVIFQENFTKEQNFSHVINRVE